MPALIFDCDGVLADTEQHGHLPAFNQTFADFNVPVQWSVDEYAEKVKIGGGKERMRSILTPEVADSLGLKDDAAKDEAVALWHKRKTNVYKDFVEAGVMPARPGIARIVQEAHDAGWTLAVASTSAEPAVRAVLTHAVASLSTAIAITALAQTDARLPASLSGRWTLMGPSGVLIDTFSMIFDGSGTPGTVPGRLTWRGVNCGAKDEPIQASWDGTELKFEAVLKANTNTQRMNGNCPAERTRWVLKRMAGDREFEGEGRVANIVVTVTATP